MQPSPSILPGHRLGYLVRRIDKLTAARLEAELEGTGVGLSQWTALDLVHSGMASTGGALCRVMGHSTGAMSRLLDQLEMSGFIDRVRDRADRRVYNIALTDAGRAALARSVAPVADIWTEMLSDLAAEDVSRTIATLSAMLGRLEACEAETAQP